MGALAEQSKVKDFDRSMQLNKLTRAGENAGDGQADQVSI